MTWPVPSNYPISTPYHKQSSGSWNACGWHTGVDFAAPAGTPLYAAIAGTIRHRSYGSAFGSKQFAISPSAGQPFESEECFYAHCSERLADGTEVQAGDYVGKVGYEGNVVPSGPAGAHLHFERHAAKNVWNCGVMRDPQDMIGTGGGGGGGGGAPATHKYTLNIYSDMLGFDQPPDGYPGGFSDTIKELQYRLNATPLVGGATISETGSYWITTDAEVRKWQEQIAHDTPDPEQKSFLGPAQRALMFPTPYVIHDRGLPPIASGGGGDVGGGGADPGDPGGGDSEPAQPADLIEGATWDPIKKSDGTYYTGLRPFTGTGERFVIHTTEGTSFPSYSGGVPHMTFNPVTNELRQHLALDVAAYAMKGGADDAHSPNSAAGVTVQVEIIGYAKDTPAWPDSTYANLSALLDKVCDTVGIPKGFPFPFTGNDGYGEGGAVRQSWDSWAAASGIVGHSHAPYNDHWDPGALDVSRLFPTEPPDPPVDPTEPPPSTTEYLSLMQYHSDMGLIRDTFNLLTGADSSRLSPEPVMRTLEPATAARQVPGTYVSGGGWTTADIQYRDGDTDNQRAEAAVVINSVQYILKNWPKWLILYLLTFILLALSIAGGIWLGHVWTDDAVQQDPITADTPQQQMGDYGNAPYYSGG